MARILVDTNLWLRAADVEARQHAVAVTAMRRLANDGHLICLTPQVLTEFWAVVTRPREANGLGWSTVQASEEVEHLRESNVLLLDRPEIFSCWLDLVRNHDIKGKRTHDARLAAVMAAHRVDFLLTFNGGDFASFPHVRLLEPTSVADGSAEL